MGRGHMLTGISRAQAQMGVMAGARTFLHPIIPVGAWMDPRAEKERLVTAHFSSADSELHMFILHLFVLETTSLVSHVV